MKHEDKSQAPIPDLTAETLMPIKGVGLSVFAKLVWLTALVILMSIVWLGFSKFDLDRFRGPDHFINKARQAIEAKDWPAALNAIQRVPSDMRNRPEYLRLQADYLIGMRANPSELAQLLEALHETQHQDASDCVWLAQTYLSLHKIGLAKIALGRASEETKQTLLYGDTEIALLRSEGRSREADQVERSLLIRFPHEPSVMIRWAGKNLVGTFPEIRHAAHESLWKAAERDDAHALTAITVLVSHGDLSSSQLSTLHTLMNQHPEMGVKERLNLLSIIILRDPTKRHSILQAEVDRYKKSSPADFNDLIEWLAREREFGKIADLVPLDSLRKSTDLFPAVAKNLADNKRWHELLRLLSKNTDLPISKARAAAWRALATHNTGSASDFETRKCLEEALAEGKANNDDHAINSVILLAEQWMMYEVALQATQFMSLRDGPTQLHFLEKSWQYGMRLKDDNLLASIAARQALLQPDNVLFTRRKDYMNLLRGEFVELACTEITSPPPKNPTDADFLIMALKYYRLGDIHTSVEYAIKIQNTQDLLPGQLAVYAGILSEGNESKRAFATAESIRPSLLLTSEVRFLKKALQN